MIGDFDEATTEKFSESSGSSSFSEDDGLIVWGRCDRDPSSRTGVFPFGDDETVDATGVGSIRENEPPAAVDMVPSCSDGSVRAAYGDWSIRDGEFGGKGGDDGVDEDEAVADGFLEDGYGSFRDPLEGGRVPASTRSRWDFVDRVSANTGDGFWTCCWPGDDGREVPGVPGMLPRVMLEKEPRWREGSTMPMSPKDELAVWPDDKRRD